MNDPKEPAPIGLVVKIIGGIVGLIIAAIFISFALLSEEFVKQWQVILLEFLVRFVLEVLVFLLVLSLLFVAYILLWPVIVRREFRKILEADFKNRKSQPRKRKSKKERKREFKNKKRNSNTKQ